ncbi:MAG TPA: metal ABC transporter permease [Zoogloea sp.]|uniref:metal ABC transporter permease n=1 Tax=Zoogloea sp. TaxID=49181 RepID=UPI002C0E327A|nr:metal ABC transporter permease [Zoogloea sp.]HMV18116.1 metal ABC transporter permease [Rhodocyclaceae bacterium]HMV64059.1 metal ABC transporter permease [Rhodocyclaceae bacterium]HMW52506.1 metal ABC transporter permease [Rhodocyclaceae bacterium]HMY50391.1 metal ABC transporter permease [Rhodocyclaceae bacterium]HMZ76466.1 metal ABC transporter permease [Rhodocyclaceae bacterium]
MSLEFLVDPLFRLPFLTGLALAGLLPVLGMYLRLRNEWLAALAFAQMASGGALVAMVADAPMLLGGAVAALLAALVKGFAARAGASAYALMMLLGWGGGVLLVANHPLAEQAGHALFDGQLYFTGGAHLLAALIAVIVAMPVLAWLSRPLLLGRFFPEFFRARGLDERPRLVLFDLIAGLSVALATVSLGVMAAFALVFVPPMVVFPRAPGWRVGLLVAAVVGMGGYVTAFALALVFDQPFGPVCAILLVLLSGLVGLIGRQS